MPASLVACVSPSSTATGAASRGRSARIPLSPADARSNTVAVRALQAMLIAGLTKRKSLLHAWDDHAELERSISLRDRGRMSQTVR